MPQITIFKGGMFTIPIIGWFMTLFYPHYPCTSGHVEWTARFSRSFPCHFFCHLIPSETISNQSSFHTLPIPALFGLTFLAALMDVHPPEGGNNRFWSIPKQFLPTTTKTNLFCWSIYPLVINIFTACLINKSSYISKDGPFTVANCYITKNV